MTKKRIPLTIGPDLFGIDILLGDQGSVKIAFLILLRQIPFGGNLERRAVVLKCVEDIVPVELKILPFDVLNRKRGPVRVIKKLNPFEEHILSTFWEPLDKSLNIEIRVPGEKISFLDPEKTA
jgi:hypothetical protein